MRGGNGRFSIFFVFFLLSIFVFVFFRAGWLDGLGGGLQYIFLPVQRMTDGFFRQEDTGEVGRLRDENAVLRVELVKMKALEKDNAALRDQFKQSYRQAEALLPADVVGMPGFLPGVSAVEEIIIDKGSEDGVRVGRVVVFKDILIGRVERVSAHLSVVDVVSHEGISFTAETSKTSALGVLTGAGGGKMVLENVLLSDKLEKGDTVVSKGDRGVPAGLVVGRIVSVKRQASSLFQSAEVASLVDVERLKMVFVKN
jgi:rod shape-determining protein MreC